MVFWFLMHGIWNVSGIRSEDTGGRKCFLRTLQKDDDGLREFRKNSRHKEQEDDKKETKTQSAKYHGNIRDG